MLIAKTTNDIENKTSPHTNPLTIPRSPIQTDKVPANTNETIENNMKHELKIRSFPNGIKTVRPMA